MVYIPSYLTAILPALNNDSLKGSIYLFLEGLKCHLSAKTVNEHLLALVNEKSDVDQQTMDHIIGWFISSLSSDLVTKAFLVQQWKS